MSEAFMSKIMIEWGHNFAYATTFNLLWHVHICELIWSPAQKNQLWDHKPFVKLTRAPFH